MPTTAIAGSGLGVPNGEAAFPRVMRVLMVEDNADDAALLQRHLQKSGLAPEVQRVETADKMLTALAEPWDCILADYNLPQFSGPEALKLLQGTGHDIPFIMMSGAVDEATAVAAMRAGAHDYISKGNLTRLVPAIERELAEAASRRIKRLTELALRSSEERFQRLVEATPLALLIIDMQGSISYSNRGAQRLLGLSPSDPGAPRASFAAIFSTGEFGDLGKMVLPSAHVARRLCEKIDGHEEETWETACCHADGTTIPVLVGAAVLNSESAEDDCQLAVFFVDLREQKRNEELLRRTEKLAAAGRLAASIAHEINNPLEAITNCMYLLEQGELDESSRSYLKMAQGELNRVTHITTQTLRFYRQSTKPVLTDIPDLIHSVLALFEGRIRAHSIQVVCDFDGVPQITALDGEIRQVLANVIGNAIDAMIGRDEPKVLLLRAKARRSWRTNSEGIAILVADCGTGMDDTTLSRIYEPFFSTKGITGTGLGLWVSAEIVNKHNGRVLVRSRTTEPSGTVFRIFLPRHSAVSHTVHEQSLPIL